MPSLTRREAVQTTAALLGAAAAGGAACAPDRRPAPNAAAGALAGDALALAEAVADTLFPTTPGSPGAREAGAGAAMNLLLTECTEPEPRRRTLAALAAFGQTARTRHGRPFAALDAPTREALVRDAYAAPDFALVRELAERGYFATEAGLTKALRYVQVPGKWVGCVELERGQRAWG